MLLYSSLRKKWAIKLVRDKARDAAADSILAKVDDELVHSTDVMDLTTMDASMLIAQEIVEIYND